MIRSVVFDTGSFLHLLKSIFQSFLRYLKGNKIEYQCLNPSMGGYTRCPRSLWDLSQKLWELYVTIPSNSGPAMTTRGGTPQNQNLERCQNLDPLPTILEPPPLRGPNPRPPEKTVYTPLKPSRQKTGRFYMLI